MDRIKFYYMSLFIFIDQLKVQFALVQQFRFVFNPLVNIPMNKSFTPFRISMVSSRLFIALLYVVFCASFATAQSNKQKKLTEYVNVFVGTGGHGHTYPGATLPFGMVQLSPDNVNEGWDWSSGYNYSDSTIAGFSHTHLSGTGIGDLCDISVMPSVGIKPDTSAITSLFSHQKEKASPGFYSVHLRDFNIDASFTTTERSGFHKYVFPASSDAMLRFDLGFRKNWDWTNDCFFKQINDTTFIGYRHSSGWAPDQKIYFAIKLSKPVKQLTLFQNKKQIAFTEARGVDVKACLQFNTVNGENILMKVGLSTANTEGALQSLDEIKGWNFDAVKQKAEDIWEKELSKIAIKANADSTKVIFYSALYHTFLAPTLFTDLNGNYRGKNGKIQTSDKPIFTTHSLWDTFRAANPLLTITQPKMIPDIMNSFLKFYDQYGLLPVWDLHFNETNTMTGYHAIPVIADAILKDIKGFDVQKAYEAMKASSMQNTRATDLYRNYGYIPHDKQHENVTITLEYAYDDWCIAQVAKKLNKPEDVAYYIKRANFYRNLFEPITGFFRPRLSDGTWATPFDPLRSEFQTNPYTEGNAWQHTFFVPHDVKGLKDLYPEKDGLLKKLDSLFSIDSKLTGTPVGDITGLIGQYAHGNEPSHHIAYLYNYLGEPWKTANMVRRITTEQYQNSPQGLSGNEDCGQMSAWYVFSALGFYPVNPASGEYVFGCPMINEAIIKVADDKKFTIKVANNSASNKYIQSVRINGKAYSKTFINHATLMKGGTMKIIMGSNPNSKWGVNIDSFPSSMSDKN